VFGTARKDVSFLADPNLGDWITDRGDSRARFDTDAFARSSDTLCSLSKEGPGSAGPMTAAAGQNGRRLRPDYRASRTNHR
jgi:hypothetical protein